VEPSEQNEFYSDHISIVVCNYYQLTGRQMMAENQSGCDVDSGSDAASAQSIFNAPYAVISHGIEAEPVFNYVNKTAMKLFNMTWDEMTKLQSRYSTEQPNREQRLQLLNEVKANGYIDNYSGIRIAKGGRRFYIEQATVWNLTDNDGVYYGQAAMFSHWRFI